MSTTGPPAPRPRTRGKTTGWTREATTQRAATPAGRPTEDRPTPAQAALAVAREDDDFSRTVLPLVSAKRVLDVGCINHGFVPQPGRHRHSSFFRIERAAAHVLGIDIVEDAVRAARAHGHNVVVGDAETFLADEPFDVVHPGDLVEHLSNPGRFLAADHANLVEGGLLVLATPNTYGLPLAMKALTGLTNDPKVHHEHTFFFTPQTLTELARRHGFEPVAIHAIEIASMRRLHPGGRLLLPLDRTLKRLFPRLKGTLLGIFRRVP